MTRPSRAPRVPTRKERPGRETLSGMATPDVMELQLRDAREWRTSLLAADDEERKRTQPNPDTLTEIGSLRTGADAEISEIESDYTMLYGVEPPTIRRRS